MNRLTMVLVFALIAAMVGGGYWYWTQQARGASADGEFKAKKGNVFLNKLTSGMSSMPAYLSAVATLRTGKAEPAMESAERLDRKSVV